MKKYNGQQHLLGAANGVATATIAAPAFIDAAFDIVALSFDHDVLPVATVG